MAIELSPLYPILDTAYLPPIRSDHDGIDHQARERFLLDVVRSMAAAGVTMLQYRNKYDSDHQVLRDAIFLRIHAPPSLRIILNDRVHLVKDSGSDGVHIGQADMSAADARALVGADRVIGLSTHTSAQLRVGDQGPADYLAVGPVYKTGSKADAENVVGLEGVRLARALTRKPLVAIGGITLERAAQVRAAGADSLAVISALFGPGSLGGDDATAAPLAKLAKDFLEVFR